MHSHCLSVCVCVCERVFAPGDCRDSCAVLIGEMSAGIEHPPVMEGHEGVACCGGVVLPILAVSVLQRRKLILSQHLVHHKLPGKKYSARRSMNRYPTSPYPPQCHL